MKTVLYISLMLLALAACTGAGDGDPVRSVEAYLDARIRGAADEMRPLLCSQLEASLEDEAASFETVSDVRLTNMACQYDAEQSVVRCTGMIEADYGLEQAQFPLGSYTVVQEAGEWKWCGESE